jgi:hypothetical protein
MEGGEEKSNLHCLEDRTLHVFLFFNKMSGAKNGKDYLKM